MSSALFPRYLEPFLGSKERALDKPFTVGRWTYATDCVTACRVPRLPSIVERRDPPPIDRYPFPALPVALALSVECPVLPARQWEPCDECAALGGQPSRECPFCRGTGRVESVDPYKLPWANIVVDAARLRRVKLYLPNVRLCKDPYPVAGSNCLGFVFDGGGSGLLMPIAPAVARL